MGSRGRSIRLRIFFLVAIPLIAMAGLLAYAAGTSISNAIDLDRVHPVQGSAPGALAGLRAAQRYTGASVGSATPALGA